MNRIALALALSLVAVQASAAEKGEQGWSVGVAGSFDDYHLDGGAIDGSAVGLKLSAMYRFDKDWAVEGGFLQSGDFKGDATHNTNGYKLSVKGFAVDGVYFIPVDIDDVEIYGKAGLFDFDQNATQPAQPNTEQQLYINSSVYGLTLGAGGMVEILENLQLRGEVEWYNVDNAEFWVVNFGVQYHFGK